MLKKLWFGTYVLQTEEEKVLRMPVHGSRLHGYRASAKDKDTFKAVTRAWQEQLKRVEVVKPSLEVLKILDNDTPPSYHELSMITKAEWLEQERSGDRSVKVGEGQGAEKTLQDRRRRANKGTKKVTNQNSPNTGFEPRIRNEQPGRDAIVPEEPSALEQDAPSTTTVAQAFREEGARTLEEMLPLNDRPPSPLGHNTQGRSSMVTQEPSASAQDTNTPDPSLLSTRPAKGGGTNDTEMETEYHSDIQGYTRGPLGVSPEPPAYMRDTRDNPQSPPEDDTEMNEPPDETSHDLDDVPIAEVEDEVLRTPKPIPPSPKKGKRTKNRLYYEDPSLPPRERTNVDGRSLRQRLERSRRLQGN